MSLLDQLDPILREFAQNLFDIAEAAGVHPRVTSGVRSYATQKKLYEAWLRGDSKYPAAPPGQSAHEYGLAFDMVVEGSVNQSDCGTVWTSWGGIYGGEEDPIHFEHPLFRTLPRRADPTGTVQTVPVYTPSSVEVRARQLADQIAPELIPELGHTIDIGRAAASIVRALGGASPAALATIEYALDHPVSFISTFQDAVKSWYFSEVF